MTLIFAAIAVSAMAVAGSWFGGKAFTAHILHGETIEDGRNWAIYLSRNLPRMLTIVGSKKPQEAERRVIESARRAAGITHFRFLAPNGKIIYSSTLKEIGKIVSDPAFIESIQDVSDSADITESADAAGGTVFFRTAYIPILDEKNRMAGAIQVMSDATVRYREFELVTLVATAGLAVILFGILVLMVIAARKRIPPVELVRPNVAPEPSPRPDNAAVSQAISRALVLVRHELRTPLAGISAMADQLRRPGATEAFPALTGALHRSSDALLDLIDTITNPSRDAVIGEPHAFKLKEAVADAIDLLAHPAEARGLQLIDVVEETLPAAVMGDRRMLGQLLVSTLNHGMEMVRNGNLLIAVREGNVPGSYDAVEFELSFSGAASPKADPGIDRSVLRRLATRLGGELLPDSTGGDLPHFVLPLPGAIGDMPEEVLEAPAPPPLPPLDEPAPEKPTFEQPAASEPADAAGLVSSGAQTLDMSTLSSLRDEQDGRPGLVERVIANYLEQSPVSLKKLADGVQRGNAPLVQMAANRLKTSSANIGAERIAELCDQMEGCARTGQLDTAEPLLSAIVTEFTQVEAVLDVELPPDDASQARL